MRVSVLRLGMVGILVLILSSAFAQGSENSTQSGGAASSGQPGKRKATTASNLTTTDPIKKAAVDSNFIIGPDDILAVNVWKEPEVSQTVTVRPDGKISLPLAGEVAASGLTPKQLETVISHQLENYMSRPEVTVIVHEVKSQRVVVVGEVAKPGSYTLQTPMTVLDAIAQAGGPLDYAKTKSIYVLRLAPDGHPTRIPFNYRQVIKGHNLTQNVRLEPFDTVVVPYVPLTGRGFSKSIGRQNCPCAPSAQHVAAEKVQEEKKCLVKRPF